jgi:hypothetical protein
MNCWDVEQPRFRIEQGPKWLSIDRSTGRMSGKPDSVGRSHVIVQVALERVKRSLDPALLQWGVEKATGTELETVGTATQSFLIDSSP